MPVVEITDTGLHLGVYRGFIEIRQLREIVARVVLDDVTAVIIGTPGCSITTVLLERLAVNNIPFVMCGPNYQPASMLLPIVGKHKQYNIMVNQARLKRPLQKRLWQSIVKRKILNQAQVLGFQSLNIRPFERLAKKVKSGDPENCEAQAARLYWRTLLGSDFRRDRNAKDINRALNYGYAIVRAAMARAVVAAGLHPTFALHHKNPSNPLNLVDDLMEPFRPVVDHIAHHHGLSGELTPMIKAQLANALKTPMQCGEVIRPLSQACLQLARSMARLIEGDSDQLDLPRLCTPSEMQAAQFE